MQTEIKVYAPVIIPTLNRDIHFKRCLESLERCSGADKTTVYVALDYPPSEKYTEGWKKIDEYLRIKEKSNGFAKLAIVHRDRNYGIGHENGNYETLLREIKKETDCYIFTEDDNEFSENFLQFINEGLVKYKSCPSVIAICGYTPPIDMNDYMYNIYCSYGLSAWGAGFWFDKKPIYNIKEIKTALMDFKVLRKIYRRSPNLVSALLDMINKNVLWGDTCFPFCNIIHDSYCIFPKVSFVRNHGHDGSGVHCGNGDDNIFLKQDIFEGEYTGIDDIEIKESDHPSVRNYILATYNWKKRIRLVIKYLKFYFNEKKHGRSE